MLERYDPGTNGTVSTTERELCDLAQRSAIPIHFFDPQRILWDRAKKVGRTSREGLLDGQYWIFRGRSGPTSFGLSVAPEQVNRLHRKLD